MRHKILVVDDHPNILQLVAAILTGRGYEVATADDGYSALLQFELDTPDLLITDLKMPGMDGYELCRTIRRSSSVPILVMTAEPGVEQQIEATKAGADAFVSKPFDLKSFLTKIEALLKQTDPAAPNGVETSNDK